VREVIARHPFPLPLAEAGRLTAAVTALGDGATGPAVEVALASAYGPRLPGPILRATAVNLTRRVAAVRRRLIARANFRDMLTGADSHRRGARRRGPGRDRRGGAGAESSTGGTPPPQAGRGADGGATNDRALSAVWNRPAPVSPARRRCRHPARLGGGRRARSENLALAPLALAVAPAALLGEPAGRRRRSLFAGRRRRRRPGAGGGASGSWPGRRRAMKLHLLLRVIVGVVVGSGGRRRRLRRPAVVHANRSTTPAIRRALRDPAREARASAPPRRQPAGAGGRARRSGSLERLSGETALHRAPIGPPRCGDGARIPRAPPRTLARLRAPRGAAARARARGRGDGRRRA
jgi:hypothetical protein